jgi:hypothetical protein
MSTAVLSGINSKDETPDCTTTEATYEDVTNPIELEALYMPTKFSGDVSSNHPFPVIGMVSIVK